MKLPKNLPRPMFIRANDYVSVAGSDYIVKRNEFGQTIKVVGRVSRKLPSLKDVIWALNAHRQVAYWGSKYFMWDRIDTDIVDDVISTIWEAEKRRGIDPPDPATLEEDSMYD